MNANEIVYVHGRRIWDSRGRPTVEADVVLAGGAVGRASSPAGASTGSGEALDLRDGGESFGGRDVSRAVASVNGDIAVRLIGLDGTDQQAVDRALIELDGTPEKRRLGANATLAASMACAHAAAGEAGVPLFRHLGGPSAGQLPLPQIQIFGGGAHAAGRIDVQDFLVVCPGAQNFAEALDMAAEVYRAAGDLLAERGLLAGVAEEGGWWPTFDSPEQALEMLVQAIDRAGYDAGDEVAIALDIAASQFGRAGRYRFAGKEMDADALSEQLAGWIEKFPIVSIEDPLAEDDPDGFIAFTARLGKRIQVVGDDLLVTDPARIAQAAASGAINAVLLKPNQRGTLTETLEAWTATQKAGTPRHRLRAVGRNGRHHDRASRGGLGHCTAEGRQHRAGRAQRQVERGAAHRGSAGPARPFRRPRRPGTMKVVLQHASGPALVARLAALEGMEAVACDPVDRARFAELMRDADVLWHSLDPVTAATMEGAPRLRLVQKIGVGVNTIDLEAAQARGIAVCNLPGSNAAAVAEMTLLLMLAALRRLPQLDRATRAGSGWTVEPAEQDFWGELGGRTVGLVGFGSIPRTLAPVLIALGCRVLHFSRTQRPDAAGWCPLPDLLEESDVVSLHVPLTAETAGIIDAAALARMKPGAVLVNTARGGLVDQSALIAALESGHLGAAGLDVFAHEPVGEAESRLLAMDRVVATPHIAWLTTGTWDRSLRRAAENVRRLAQGEALLDRVC